MNPHPIDGSTKLAGVIGDPISHTASPAMHNAAYTQLGLNAVYVPLHVKSENLKEALNGLRGLSFMGANVTIPHKEAVIPFLDELDPSAAKVGAVNTILVQNGKLIGHNTDGQGFIYSLRHEAQFDCNSKKILLIGAGGSSKGLTLALLQEGVSHLTIVSRRVEAAEEIKTKLSDERIHCVTLDHSSKMYEYLAQADCIINTTPVGMPPLEGESPLQNYDWVRPAHLCCDIIYKPKMTAFLIQCQEKGATILGGAGMLAGQGVLAFQLMTGQVVPFEVMRAMV